MLPSSSNVIMAAERACELSEKPARVVRSTSQQASLLALVELDQGAPAAENAERLDEALEGIATGGVAPAARDDAQGRFRQGDAVGFAGGEIVAWGGAGSTLAATIEELAEGAEIVTVIAGEGAPIPLDEIDPTCPTGSRSRPTRAASRAGGGCSPPSRVRAPFRRRTEPLQPSSRGARPLAAAQCPRRLAHARSGVGPKLAEAAAEAGISTRRRPASVRFPAATATARSSRRDRAGGRGPSRSRCSAPHPGLSPPRQDPRSKS